VEDNKERPDPTLGAKKSNSGQFKKGEHRTGRKKGVPNKCTVAARNIMDGRNYNPVDALIDIAEDPDEHPDRRLRAHGLLLDRAYPRLHDVHEHGEVQVEIEELNRRMREGRERVQKFRENSQ
jgi:hypothetical protein